MQDNRCNGTSCTSGDRNTRLENALHTSVDVVCFTRFGNRIPNMFREDNCVESLQWNFDRGILSRDKQVYRRIYRIW